MTSQYAVTALVDAVAVIAVARFEVLCFMDRADRVHDPARRNLLSLPRQVALSHKG